MDGELTTWDDDDEEVDRYSSGRRSGNKPGSEKGSDVCGVWIVGNVEEMEDEEASGAFSEDGADRLDGFSKMCADQRDGFNEICADQRDGFSRSRAGQRDGSSKIRAEQDDGFSQNSRRKTCKRARGGQKETTVPMKLDYVSGNELYAQDWADVDEVRRERRCCNCGMMEDMARDCRMKERAKGKGG